MNIHTHSDPDREALELLVHGFQLSRMLRLVADLGIADKIIGDGARERAEAEFRGLLDQSGFALTRIMSTPSRVSIIEAMRVGGRGVNQVDDRGL